MFTMKTLSDTQLMRYSRHIMLNEMDIDGQEQLYNSKLLIIGVGGLGCAAAQYLVASGIGEITLVDDDVVEKNNLQRQILHTEQSVGLTKCQSAKQQLQQLNSDIVINTIERRLDDNELLAQVSQHNVVLDCTDNLTSRNAINQACFNVKVPLVSGAAIRFEGQVSVFSMQTNSPCYHCVSSLFGEQNLTCVDAGVLSPLVGMVGSMQAIETIKLLANIGTNLTGKLLMIDAKDMQINTFAVPKLPHCDVCGS